MTARERRERTERNRRERDARYRRGQDLFFGRKVRYAGDAVWEAVEGELLSPVVAEMDRAEWERGRREQEERRRRG